MNLTNKQKETLIYIGECIEEHGCSPTVAEMMSRFNLSGEFAVTDRIRRLEAKGYIVRGKRNTARNIRLSNTGKTVVNLQTMAT